MSGESTKETALTPGKKLLNGVLELVKKAAAATLKLIGKGVGLAWGFIKEKGGAAAKRCSEKLRTKLAAADSVLLALGLAFAGLSLLAFLLRCWSRKK